MVAGADLQAQHPEQKKRHAWIAVAMSLFWPGYGLLYLGKRRLGFALYFAMTAVMSAVLFMFMDFRFALAIFIVGLSALYSTALVAPIVIVNRNRYLPAKNLPKRWEYVFFAALAAGSSYWFTGRFEAQSPYRVVWVGEDNSSSLVTPGDLIVVRKGVVSKHDFEDRPAMIIAVWSPQWNDENENVEHFLCFNRIVSVMDIGPYDLVAGNGAASAFEVDVKNCGLSYSARFFVPDHQIAGEAIYVGFSLRNPGRIGKRLDR